MSDFDLTSIHTDSTEHSSHSPTPFHHAFLVDEDDYQRAVATLEREGIATWNCTAMRHTTYPGRRHIYFNDPDGNSVELATLLPGEGEAP